MSSMNSLSWLYAICTVVFVGLFIYTWMMSSRQKRLEEKLDQLRAQLKETNR